MVSDLPKSTNFDIGRFMPRHPRVHAQGLLYHVMARGNDGRKVFLKDSDCEAFRRFGGGAKALSVLPLRLRFDVGPLPSALGSAASLDGAGAAVVVDRIHAAI